MNESWGGVFDRTFVITYPEGIPRVSTVDCPHESYRR